jgi:hypothetical protein
VLDTNVVIDMSNFYFGRSDSPELRADLHALLRTFPDARFGTKVDMNYGFATTEGAWKRGVGHDRADHRRLVHAASTMVEWTLSDVKKNFANRHPPVSRDRSWPSNVGLAPADDAVNPAVVMPSYGCLLYLCHLDRTRAIWRARGPLYALTTYLDWMTEELGAVDGYVLQLVLDLLFGSDERMNGVRRLLKLGGREEPDLLADRCWNAAWDLLFLKTTEGTTFGLGVMAKRPRANTALVTRNLDPGFVRAQSEIRGVIELPDPRGNIGLMEIDWSQHPRAREDEAVRELLARRLSDPSRLIGIWLDVESAAQQARNATREVETLVGVTKSALVGLP